MPLLSTRGIKSSPVIGTALSPASPWVRAARLVQPGGQHEVKCNHAQAHAACPLTGSKVHGASRAGPQRRRKILWVLTLINHGRQPRSACAGGASVVDAAT